MSPSKPKDESEGDFVELECGSFVQIKEQDIGPTSPEEQQTSGLAYRWNMLKSYLDELTGAPKPVQEKQKPKQFHHSSSLQTSQDIGPHDNSISPTIPPVESKSSTIRLNRSGLFTKKNGGLNALKVSVDPGKNGVKMPLGFTNSVSSENIIHEEENSGSSTKTANGMLTGRSMTSPSNPRGNRYGNEEFKFPDRQAFQNVVVSGRPNLDHAVLDLPVSYGGESDSEDRSLGLLMQSTNADQQTSPSLQPNSKSLEQHKNSVLSGNF